MFKRMLAQILQVLGKLVVQHGIKALFGRRSCVRTSLLYIYIPNLLSPKEADCGCLLTGLCVSPRTDMGLLVRTSVKVHDIHCGPKSYQLKP